MGIGLDVGMAQTVGHDEGDRIFVVGVQEMGPGIDGRVHFSLGIGGCQTPIPLAFSK